MVAKNHNTSFFNPQSMRRRVMTQEVQAVASTRITGSEAGDVIALSTERPIGISFPIKRCGNNTTITYKNIEAYRVSVIIPSDGMMTVTIDQRRLQPYSWQCQAKFLKWLANAKGCQKNGGVYGHPDCEFVKI